MKFLNKYLFSLASNKIIKSSQIFYEFLTLDEETFNAKKKEYHKIFKGPLKINEMRNLEGQLDLKLIKEEEAHADMIKNYTNLNEIILKKLGTSYKSLFAEIEQVSTRLAEISDLYDQLYTISYKTKDVKKF